MGKKSTLQGGKWNKPLGLSLILLSRSGRKLLFGSDNILLTSLEDSNFVSAIYDILGKVDVILFPLPYHNEMYILEMKPQIMRKIGKGL